MDYEEKYGRGSSNWAMGSLPASSSNNRAAVATVSRKRGFSQMSEFEQNQDDGQILKRAFLGKPRGRFGPELPPGFVRKVPDTFVQIQAPRSAYRPRVSFQSPSRFLAPVTRKKYNTGTLCLPFVTAQENMSRKLDV